jgi:hypothetical protein
MLSVYKRTAALRAIHLGLWRNGNVPDFYSAR